MTAGHAVRTAKMVVSDLAVFGGAPAFAQIKSTANLAAPDQEAFFGYARQIYARKRLGDTEGLVAQLERRLAGMHGTKCCVACCSGYMALMLAVHALALKDRQEVILPSLTYRKMDDIIAWLGFVPHFCDVDAVTLGMSRHTVEPCLSDKTALILGVHPIVHLCDIDGLSELSTLHAVPLVFDSVEAACASWKGTMVGGHGHAEVFSLHASKLVNGFEGGYITTNDQSLADSLRSARDLGNRNGETAAVSGLNARLNEIHAAVAMACLDVLESQIERNREIVRLYAACLQSSPELEVVTYDESEKRGHKNVLVRLSDDWPLSRDATLQVLHAENILARPHYSPPLHTKKASYRVKLCGELPVTNERSLKYLLLPCGDFVSISDVRVVVDILLFLKDHAEEIGKRMNPVAAA